MQWLYDLIKHITVSRLFTSAVFITSTALLFGGKLWPNYVQEVKSEWRVFIVGAAIFSGVYLAFWGIQILWSVVCRGWRGFTYWNNADRISKSDEFLIELIASQPYASLNVMLLNVDVEKVSRLEIIQQAKMLTRTGLVEVSSHDEAIVNLTEAGKKRAADLLRSKRLGNA